MFNYFSRKEDLVLAWFESRRANIASVLAENENVPGGTSYRLHQAFQALSRIFLDDPVVGRGMVRAWLQAGSPLLTPDSETIRLFADAIRAGQEHGDIAPDIDSHQAGRLLFDAYIGELCRWVTAENRASPGAKVASNWGPVSGRRVARCCT